MFVKAITEKEIKDALKDVNAIFNDNVVLSKCEPLNRLGTKHKVILRVKPKAQRAKGDNKGVKFSPMGNLTASACWHVHGFFFEALFARSPNCKIKTAFAPKEITSESGNWQDWLEGSYYSPNYVSDSCECDL